MQNIAITINFGVYLWKSKSCKCTPLIMYQQTVQVKVEVQAIEELSGQNNLRQK